MDTSELCTLVTVATLWCFTVCKEGSFMPFHWTVRKSHKTVITRLSLCSPGRLSLREGLSRGKPLRDKNALLFSVLSDAFPAEEKPPPECGFMEASSPNLANKVPLKIQQLGAWGPRQWWREVYRSGQELGSQSHIDLDSIPTPGTSYLCGL